MTTLIVRPLGGLANRIRVIKAAQSYANKYAARLIIIWDKDNVLNAKYEDCFEPIDRVKVINISYSGHSSLHIARKKIIHRLYLLIIKLSSQIQVYDLEVRNHLNEEKGPRIEEPFFIKLARDYRKVYIQTCYEFHYQRDHFFIPIKKSIVQKCRTLILHSDMIGVHVRRGDNLMSHKYSPLDLFIKKMDENIGVDPSTTFYVSTDSNEVYETLKQIFGDKVYTAATVRSRDTLKGIQSALLDFYCLSKCKKILGSYDSSFSEIAAKMGKIPLEVISTI